MVFVRRQLVAKKFEGSKHGQYPGRPTVPAELEALAVRMARENTGWGYDRTFANASKRSQFLVPDPDHLLLWGQIVSVF
jgi:hypothetical protein